MKHLLAIAVLAFSGAAYAAPITIDFEEFAPQSWSGYFPNGVTIQSQGFNVTGLTFGLDLGDGTVFLDSGETCASTFAAFPAAPCANDSMLFGGIIGSISQDGFGPRVTFELARSDGGAFALYSADFVALGVTSHSRVVGVTSEGHFFSQNLADLSLGVGDWLNIVQATFIVQGDGFNGGIAYGEIDNIGVGAAVPIPAAAWLFLSALGALGLRRRFVE